MFCTGCGECQVPVPQNHPKPLPNPFNGEPAPRAALCPTAELTASRESRENSIFGRKKSLETWKMKMQSGSNFTNVTSGKIKIKP